MPFGRRSRASSMASVDHNTMAAATAAAGQAYLHSATSSASLSSAAAAAALRTHATSPEPVGSLQTKRMVRRGSQSSVGSGSVPVGSARGGMGRGGLQRTNSGGSMTERTFRSPSPGRNNSLTVGEPAAPDAPPVPALPRGIPAMPVPKRASSVEPPPRVTSPTPTRGRGMSADRIGAAVRNSIPQATSRQAKRLSNVREAEELERQLSNSMASKNFSRPMSQLSGQQNSPATSEAGAKKYTHGTGSWFSGPSGGGTARGRNGDFDNSQHRGSSTSQGAADYIMVYDPNSRTFQPKPRHEAQQSSSSVPASTQNSVQTPVAWDPNTRSIVPATPDPTQKVSSRPHTPSNVAAADGGQRKKQRPIVPAVDTALAPPPRNPARLSPTGSTSPTSPRAAGILHKQPSVVREMPEEEEEEAGSAPLPDVKIAPRTIQTSAGPAKAYVAPKATHQRSTSLDVPRPGGEGGRGRIVSHSPHRSAHFSASPVIEAARHNPPLRSVSPAKSAMKSSPGSSIRNPSPLAYSPPQGPKAPPSDAGSDTTLSQTSSDIMGPTKKKKSARVSFDEQLREINAAGAVESPRAITTLANNGPSTKESEVHELMTPRPALPSFGSVRRNGRPMQTEMAEKVTETPPERDGSSNDHAIGAILANERNKHSENEPLPPDVVSKEPSGYISDESDEGFKPDASSTPVKPTDALSDSTANVGNGDVKTRDFATTAINGLPPTSWQKASREREQSDNVPAINLLPPTPGLDEESKELQDAPAEESSPKPRRSMEAFSVPGSWGMDEESSDYRHVAADSEPAAAPTSANTAPVIAAQAAAQRQALQAIDEDSDDSAAFSDAAEDLSDLEDEGGFASLDAIVTTPLAVTPSPTALKGIHQNAQESPSANHRPKKPAQADQQPGDWSQATAYWSQLSRSQKQQIERGHVSSDEDEEERPVAATQKAKKKTAISTTQPSNTGTDPTKPQQPQVTTSAAHSNATPAMRKSMRGSQGAPPSENDVHMRRSMRPGSVGGMQLSLRERRPQSQQQQRPQSAFVPSTGPQGSRVAVARPASSDGPVAAAADRMRTNPANGQSSAYPSLPQNKQAPQARSAAQAPAAQQTGAFTAKLQKQVTNDSDSESSFKRKRRASVSTMDSNTGRYNMRRSMRAGSVDIPPVPTARERPTSPTPGRGTFSLRSLSPTSSYTGRAKGEKLLGSLRSGSVDAGPRRTTLRSSQPPRGGGMTMRSTPRPATASAAAPQKSAFKSRFAPDSDDEDDSKPKRSFFSSRFADSDDEDSPTSPRVTSPVLAPVRGIPRRQGQTDGDSTDLEDEEDDDDPRKASRKREKLPKPIVPDPADVEKAMEAARRKLGIPAPNGANTDTKENKQGETLSKGSLRSPQVDPSAEPERPEPKSRPGDMPEKRKRSFMGTLLRRNRNSSQSVQQVTSPLGSAAPGSPATPIVPPLPESAIEQQSSAIPASPSVGKLVRKSSLQPESKPKITRGDSERTNATAVPNTSTATPSGGGILRNKTSTDNWPLQSPPKFSANGMTNVNDRPNTSDGVNPEAIKLARTMRPDIGMRSQSGNALGSSRPHVRIADDAGGEEDEGPGASPVGDAKAGGIYSKRTGKKKKFGMLRRAFGLND